MLYKASADLGLSSFSCILSIFCQYLTITIFRYGKLPTIILDYCCLFHASILHCRYMHLQMAYAKFFMVTFFAGFHFQFIPLLKMKQAVWLKFNQDQLSTIFLLPLRLVRQVWPAAKILGYLFFDYLQLFFSYYQTKRR